ncbi:peroxiredoxin Q [Fomitiporia mediterranea MF3/22]|uniref:peroxiredoxin Q n=1 Tax=Fomitiporia mediterranea (strain MF3/22) TaxID=694068 RepID=UPI00044084F4|nr:peroxiredoxin Q [Fomitiporia mediterranea MF3/22]EJC97896.1 peroxiredoxin Q [Fomitiporia mediterranea MF3/22]
MKKHSLLGKKAPELSLPNFDGSTFAFTPGASGRPTALFFYPQSGTYGCTKEACQFRDALSEEEIFRSTNIEVIGISPDPVEKQKKFVEKNNLTYPILSDEKGEARKAYDVSKGLLGLTASSRVTFVIDSEGTVKDAFDSTLNFSAHHKFVQDWLKSTQQPKEPSNTETAAAPAPTAEPDAGATPADKPAETGETTA